MLLNKDQATKLIAENIEILQQALNNNVTSKDIINFGYRKNQLSIFENLLHTEGYFNEYKNQTFDISGKFCKKTGGLFIN